jgi:hypothetical protein
MGLLGAAAAWFWPATPLWRRASHAGTRILGFGPGDRTLYTSDRLGEGPSTARVCRWDAATGELLEEVVVRPVTDTEIFGVSMGPDGATLLVAEIEFIKTPTGSRPVSVCFLRDLKTGQLRAGRVAEVGQLGSNPFSPDGRWFWFYHASPKSQPGVNHFDGIEIISTASGENIATLRERDEEFPVDCCFSPDGRALAVRWCKLKTPAARHSVEIIEVPSGKERRRFELPDQPWHRLYKLVGDRLYAEAYIVDTTAGQRRAFRRTYSFDLGAESIGDGTEEPLLGGMDDIVAGGNDTWEEGADWVAHLRLGFSRPRPWERWLQKTSALVGLESMPEAHVRLRFLDRATGEVRSELADCVTFPCCISSDGKRVACVRHSGHVEVWSTEPQRRWPWTVAAGIAAAAPVLAWGRWRSRSSELSTA